MNNQLLYAYTAVFSVFSASLDVMLNGESIGVKLICLLLWFTTSLFVFLFHSPYKKLKQEPNTQHFCLKNNQTIIASLFIKE
jgi:hypothetical protein